MKKKDKTPLPFKIIRWTFPKLEKLAPSIANRWAMQLFFTPIRFPVPEKEKAVLSTGEAMSINEDGVDIKLHHWGDGPLVVLAHGWSGRGGQFREFVQPLVDAGFKVVTFDGPAHGASSGKKTNIIQYGKIINRIVAEFGEVHTFICHSFGGVATLYAMQQHDLAAERVIMISTPTIGDHVISEFLKKINGSERVGDYFRSFILKNFGKTFDDFSVTNIIQDIPEIPMLLVHDEHDLEVPLFHAERLKAIREAELFATSGLGHTRILKDEEVVNKCVSFLSDGEVKAAAPAESTRKYTLFLDYQGVSELF